jgi:hypothetical protein
VASPVLPCALVCLRPRPPGPCQRRTAELIMLPDAGCYRVPGKPKDLETRGPQNPTLSAELSATFSRHSVAVGIGEPHALVTVAISHGLLGRPVPSALLPSWPSPAIDATTSRDALSILPKIVKFGF